MFKFMKRGEIHNFFLSSLEESKKLAQVSDSSPLVIYTTDDAKAVLGITKHDFFNECGEWLDCIKLFFQEEKPPISSYVEMWVEGKELCECAFDVLKACPHNKDLPDTIRVLFAFQYALVDTLLQYRNMLDDDFPDVVHPSIKTLEDTLAEIDGVARLNNS